jgi:hypothetical protein
LRNYCWLQTLICLNSASWVAGIAGVSHRCPAMSFYWMVMALLLYWGTFSWFWIHTVTDCAHFPGCCARVDLRQVPRSSS